MKKRISSNTLKKLKEELSYLKDVKRKELSQRLNEAISFGDLKENAAYHEAKDDQAFTEGRILELEHVIRTSVVSDAKNSNRVEAGVSVVVESESGTEEFEIVTSIEADPANGKISDNSLIGESLLGAKEGDLCNIEMPSGEVVRYKILKIK